MAPQSAASSTISLKSWLCAQFFLIIKNVILKKHLEIKWLIWHLVSTDCKDALNAICQTLAFLLDISLKHCLFFTDNYGDWNLSDLETLQKGALLIFLVCQQKLCYLHFHEKMNDILQSHPFLTEEKQIKKTFHMIPVWTCYFS